MKKKILPLVDSIKGIFKTDILSEDEEDLEAWHYDKNDLVLIAEIPKASTRWNQANFDKENFINFFCYKFLEIYLFLF